jgi:hypothetical protein
VIDDEVLHSVVFPAETPTEWDSSAKGGVDPYRPIVPINREQVSVEIRTVWGA